ncbi:MAG: glycosyltransferase family 4 protein [Flavobacteriaceae bacterium]|nr:glycosyltransferase family 4 protein [Flavobacteriaceae bacterium]
MKILMVSMVSIHFTRWVAQLKDSGHDVYWFDPLDGNYENKQLNWLHYCKRWRLRWNFPGRYFIKNKLPWLYRLIQRINERPIDKAFEAYLQEVQPDVVHSFVLQSGTLPLVEIMQKQTEMPWVYSAWGNDLYFRQKNEKDLRGIQYTLPHIDFMFADCSRDYFLAKQCGFQGVYLGTFPTGGGYELNKYTPFLKDWNVRKTFLVKGYQGKLGRCNKVLEALSQLQKELLDFNIVVFGANDLVKYASVSLGLSNWKNFTIYEQLSHNEVLRLMGESKIYIGNSISDGMPNTMLEAILMEVFPIQSNPGGATEELIADGVNGLLLKNPEDANDIAEQIKRAIQGTILLENAVKHNSQHIKPYLEREYIQKQVLDAYKTIERSTNQPDEC